MKLFRMSCKVTQRHHLHKLQRRTFKKRWKCGVAEAPDEMFECSGRGVHSQVLVSVAHIWKREEFLPPEPNPPCAVQPMCNDGSSSWKCQNKNWNSCRWTYERCWESGIQFNPLPIIPVSQKHFPTFNAGELAKGNLLHLKSHGLCTQPRKWEGVLVLVVVPQIGRPHHVLAPHPLLGATQRNEQGEEYASPPSRRLHSNSSQYISG